MKTYKAYCQAWIDIVAINDAAQKAFNIQLAPEVKEYIFDGQMDGFEITFSVHEALDTKINLNTLKKMAEPLEYGHHFIENLELL